MLDILVLLVSCTACNPPPVDPPPPTCDPGSAYTFHQPIFFKRVGYPATVTPLVTGTVITINLTVFTNTQALFDDFDTWVNQRWNKAVSNCGKSYQMFINLNRSIFANGSNIEVIRIITLPPGGNFKIDACGRWIIPGGSTPTKIEIYNNAVCPQNITAAHEFGHEVGFKNAYEENTFLPLHTQIIDIMTAFGTTVLGAHGRILAEEYGN